MKTVICPSCGADAERPQSAPFIPFCLKCGWQVAANLSLARWARRLLGSIVLGLSLLMLVDYGTSRAGDPPGGALLFFVFLFGLAYACVVMHMRRLSSARLPNGIAASEADTAVTADSSTTGMADQWASDGVTLWAAMQKPRRVRFRVVLMGPTVVLLGVLSLMFIMPMTAPFLRREPVEPGAYMCLVLIPTALGFVGYTRYSREQTNRKLLAEGEVTTGSILGRVTVSVVPGGLLGLLPISASGAGKHHIVTYKYYCSTGARIATCYYYWPLELACTVIPVFYDEAGASVASGGTGYEVVRPLNFSIAP